MTVVAAALALAGGASCGGADGGDGPERQEIVGVVTGISRSGDGIEAITVRSGGDSRRIELDPAVDYGFDVDHLEVHRETRDPVRCRVVRRGDDLVATLILDA